MDPIPGTATEKDLIATIAKDRIQCELIDGVLVEKAMGAKESLLGAWLVRVLWNFAYENDLGCRAGCGRPTRFRLGLVRIPDVSFVSWERIPGEGLPRSWDLGTSFPIWPSRF